MLGVLLLNTLLGIHSARALTINLPAGGDIQSAIIQVSAAGGGTVNLAPATWTLTSGLAMFSNVTLNGAGPATILQAPAGPNGVTLISNAYEGLTNVTISNLVLDGRIPRSALIFNQFAPRPYGGSGVVIFAYNNWNTNIRLSHVEIKNTVAGILMGVCNGVTIDHCNIHDNGVYFSHNIYFRLCQNMTLDHTRSNYSTLGDGLHVAGAGCIGLTINKCEFLGNAGIGILIQDGCPFQTITNSAIQFSQNDGLDTYGLYLTLSQLRTEFNNGEGAQVIDTSSGILGNDIGIGNSGDQFWAHGVGFGSLMFGPTPNIYWAQRAIGATGPTDTADWLTTPGSYSGMGAVDFHTNHSTNGLLIWPGVSAPATHSYPMTFHYTNGSTTPASLALTINGTPAGTISFPPTGGWSNWGSVSFNKILNTGGNTVQVAVVPGKAAPALDCLIVATGTASAPAVPTGLTAVGISPSQIDLTWNPVPGAGSYVVWRSLGGSGGPYRPIAADVTEARFSDSHLILGGTPYYYVVQAVNTAGSSGFSAEASASTILGAPAVLYATGQYNAIALQFLASAGASSYNLKRSTLSGGPYQTIANITSSADLGSTNVFAYYTDTTVIPGLTYFYVCAAVNGTGESTDSPEASATTQLIYNGSFETPSVGMAGFRFAPAGSGWTFSGDSGIQANGSLLNPPGAPDGNQTAFVECYPGTPIGSISQSVNFPSAGSYVMTFMATSVLGIQPLQFSVDGVAVGATIIPPPNFFYPLATASFVISTPGAHTLTLGAAIDSGNMLTLIDSVSLTKIATAAPVLGNAGFETPSLGLSRHQYAPSNASWTFTGNAGIQSNGVDGFAIKAPEGVQTAFLQGNPGPTLIGLGSMSQTVNFTGIGNFVLTFQAARRLGQIQPIKFTVDGVQVGDLLTPAGRNFSPLTSAPFTITTTGPHTLTLSSTESYNNLTTLIDQVALVAQ